MAKQHRIPRKANASVQFLGVDMVDTIPFIVSVCLGIMLNKLLGAFLTMALVAGGVGLSKMLVLWKSRNHAGAVTGYLYSKGLTKYSSAFDKKNKIFLGDGDVVIASIRSRNN